MARLQKKFVRVVRSGKAYSAFDDQGSILEELKDWMVTHWAVDPVQAGEAVEAFKKKVQVLSAAEMADESHQPSGEETDVVSTESSGGDNWEICAEKEKGESDEKAKFKKKKADGPEKRELAELVDRGAKRAPKERKKQHLAEERQGGFVVVYQRAGRGTSCSVMPGYNGVYVHIAYVMHQSHLPNSWLRFPA